MATSRRFPRATGDWYKVAASAERAEIWIYDVIGDDWVDPSLTAKALCEAIAEIEAREILLHLASPGGSAADGMAIYNALVRHPARVVSQVEGWTGSIATVIALAADEVRMWDNAFIMIHNAWALAVGDARALRETAEFLDQVTDTMVRAYMSRCSRPEDELRAALDEERILDATEAAAWGFVDEVVTATKAAAAIPADRLEALGYRRAPAALGSVEPPVPRPVDPAPGSGDSGCKVGEEVARLVLAGPWTSEGR